MKYCLRIILVGAAGLVLFAGTASGQVDGVSAFAETTEIGAQVDVHVTLNVYDAVTPGITGWIVEREVVGNCMGTVDVGEVMPMPTALGEHSFVVTDYPTVAGKHIYYIYGVDDAGARYWILWPRRTHYAQEDVGLSFAARGTVVELSGGQLYLEVCQDECWWELSYFDPIFPELQDPPEPGMQVGIFGEIMMGMEGYYIFADQWVPSDCQVVGTRIQSWGSLKAQYR